MTPANPTAASKTTAAPGDRSARVVIGAISLAVVLVVGYLLLGHRAAPGAGPLVAVLPLLNACLNATSAALLAAGWFFIRRRRVVAHKACMISALVVSTLFLVSYVTYHSLAGSRPFAGTGWIRLVYYPMLVSHIVLAAAIVPLALTTVYRALQGRFARHVRFARWTLPIWLYVSVTGVLVYWMLYRLLILIVVLGLLAPELAAAQAAGKPRRVGFVSMRSGPMDNPHLDGFRQGLGELGYVEGRDVMLEVRYAQGNERKLPNLVAELVRLKVDVIVAQSGVAALAAKRATRTIPIVMTSSGDAVKQGLVESLARPGGNVTGLTMISPDLSRKRLEILREMLPKVSKVGVLWCGPGSPMSESEWEETQAAAHVLRVQPASLSMRGTSDATGAFASATQQRLEALVVLDCARLHARAEKIVELSRANRLPALYPYSIYPDAGGLMSYGPDLRDGARRAAAYVDKILKGARPADLPVEQPTKFELVVNLTAAKALGLTVPQTILVRADRMVQ